MQPEHNAMLAPTANSARGMKPATMMKQNETQNYPTKTYLTRQRHM